ncbi:1-phosphofructokinase [Psychromonas algicola]|uniref:1-phosphofructokinase n=1 Tax=Psychromonas algicola TaxID=2555642 RepID=UPI001067F95B|nr:1-phosphofructokinase [Psychromonas sp. RZ5]TEW51449.1 1-phosphofructokinase [Psychromonas sp. RZ5]
MHKKTHTKVNKVVAVTLNPALDLTGNLASLKLGSLNLVDQGTLHAAGKGVNVAKVLSDLGAEVTVTGFLGCDNDSLFCNLFNEIKATDKFVRVTGSTRINVKLVEENGQVSDINFPGIYVSPQAIIEFEKTLFELAETHDFFVFAGSLAQGISPELCANWIQALKQRGKKVIFDSSGAALAAGVEALPWFIKPNEHELSELVGGKLLSLDDYQQAAERLANKGIEQIVVSLGAKGVMWLSKDGKNLSKWRYGQPPEMKIVSTVGAGDSLVAGFCWAAMQGWQAELTLSFATAISALAVSQVGVGVANINIVTELQNKIMISDSEFKL